MSPHFLKDTLAEAVKDPSNPSCEEVLGFMGNIASQLKGWGIPEWGNGSGKPDAFAKQELSSPIGSLYRFSDVVECDRRIISVDVLTDMKLTGPSPALISACKHSDMRRNPPDPEFVFVGGLARLTAAMPKQREAVQRVMLRPRFTNVLLIDHYGLRTDDDRPSPGLFIDRYDWRERMDAVKEFRTLIAQHGSPALSAALRAVEAPILTPLRTVRKL